MFSKILIANRGEIAVRIIRACKEMGVATVAVYSEADKNALHVALADQSYCIGGPEASESYLNENQIISTAILAGAQAIHPGYGFLSENAHFARACRKNGLVFIGPDPESMERIGNKALLKELIRSTCLTVIPGTKTVASAAEARQAADGIGYPVMLKACAGGGGRGIRLIHSEDELEDAYYQATSEAVSAFGDGSVYLEKYIFPARHVELQILADEHGNAVCLGDRDCSLQRRNQKLLEETPSPAVNDGQRQGIIELAVDAVKKIGYVGAGTLEFLLDREGNFWFMEMNTRIQVEHPVTEWVTGIDLVKEQLKIASGMPLEISQEDVRIQGHAIECRINAENPQKNFRPSPGTIQGAHFPGGNGIRVDTCVYNGCKIPPYYDSMLAKLIVHAGNRKEAIAKMQSALGEVIIDGIDTNIDYQYEILKDEDYQSGNFDTGFLASHIIAGVKINEN